MNTDKAKEFLESKGINSIDASVIIYCNTNASGLCRIDFIDLLTEFANQKTEVSDEEIEIVVSHSPSVKMGLDDFYGFQTTVNLLKWMRTKLQSKE